MFDPSRISLREEKQVYKGIPYLVFQQFVMQQEANSFQYAHFGYPLSLAIFSSLDIFYNSPVSNGITSRNYRQQSHSVPRDKQPFFQEFGVIFITG